MTVLLAPVTWSTLSALSACGGAQQGDCYATAGDGTQQRTGGCFQSNSAADALVAVGVAATATAVVGCTVNGCLPPYRCNEATKLCEMIHCDENEPCPAAYTCDLETHRCE